MLTWLTFGIFLVGKFENEGEFANLWGMISRFDLKIGQKQSHFRLSNQFWPIALSPISISFCHRQAKKKKKRRCENILRDFFFNRIIAKTIQTRKLAVQMQKSRRFENWKNTVAAGNRENPMIFYSIRITCLHGENWNISLTGDV